MCMVYNKPPETLLNKLIYFALTEILLNKLKLCFKMPNCFSNQIAYFSCLQIFIFFNPLMKLVCFLSISTSYLIDSYRLPPYRRHVHMKGFR